MFSNSNTRGVKLPDGQVSERSDAPPLTITTFSEIRMFGLTYVDSGGRERPLLVVLNVDGSLYSAPEGDQWITRLKPLSTKLAENFREVYQKSLPSTEPVKVPGMDNVDVIANEEVKVSSERRQQGQRAEVDVTPQK